MNNKILNDLVDIIEPNIELNTGSSGEGTYGNYCEWQNLDSYDDDMLEALQEYFVNQLPPKRYKTRDDIIKFLRELGVPEETAWEFGENFPEEKGYFYTRESEYLFYEYELKLGQYIKEVDTLRGLIIRESDHLIKKSLLFTIFSLTESYVKQVVWNSVPNIEENVISPILSDLLIGHINDCFKTKDKLKFLSKKLDINIGAFPHDNLRNFLAHNVGLPIIVDDKIEFTNEKSEVVRKDISVVIVDLLEFAQKVFQGN